MGSEAPCSSHAPLMLLSCFSSATLMLLDALSAISFVESLRVSWRCEELGGEVACEVVKAAKPLLRARGGNASKRLSANLNTSFCLFVNASDKYANCRARCPHLLSLLLLVYRFVNDCDMCAYRSVSRWIPGGQAHCGSAQSSRGGMPASNKKSAAQTKEGVGRGFGHGNSKVSLLSLSLSLSLSRLRARSLSLHPPHHGRLQSNRKTMKYRKSIQ